jgi:hypothetical protein
MSIARAEGIHTITFEDALRIEVATLQAQHPVLADGLSRAHALLKDGAVFPEDDGKTAMVKSSKEERYYHTNGTCTCPASEYREEPCKHRLAFRLYQRVSARMAKGQRRSMPEDILGTPEPEAELRTDEGIPPQFITLLHGKPYVRYVGLLSLAHERGLVKLEARFVSVTAELALAEATATFADGRIFTEAADSTPANCGVQVRAHYPRMALVRAKARCLRDALACQLTAIEELAE